MNKNLKKYYVNYVLMERPVVITDYFKPVQNHLNLFRAINKKIVIFMKDKIAIIMQNHPFKQKGYQMRITDYYPTSGYFIN